MANEHDTALHECYTTFAMQYGLGPGVVITLPALFERSADEVGITPLELCERTIINKELGEYLAGVAREVSMQFWADKGSNHSEE